MKKSTLLALLGIVVVVAIYFLFTYNGLVRASEVANNQWAQVESQYQRRFDLVPNLVASVKGVLNQEQAVFGEIADARTRYSGATSVDEKVVAAGELESAIGRLLVIVEQYPVLKSSENVQTLMAQLEGTENRISVERGRFNDAIRSYNLKIKTFPSRLVASIFGFEERTYFEAVEESKEAPKVEL